MTDRSTATKDAPHSPAVALAEQLIIEIDPDLHQYLTSPDRTAGYPDGIWLIAERLQQLGTTSAAHIGAIAALEATMAHQAAEIERLTQRLGEVENQITSKLAISAIVVGVLVAATGIAAGIAQIYDVLAGGT